MTDIAEDDAGDDKTLRAELAGLLAQPSVGPAERVADELLRARILSDVHGGTDEVRVDRFVLKRELGSGAFGVVYLAHDPQLRCDVALKILNTAATEAIKRFEREAQALANVRGEHVVHVLNTGEHHGRRWIAMEYVEGVTLRHWLQELHERASLDWRPIVERFIEAGRGLAELHRSGLVHRDFKPHNVMLDRRAGDRARVLDFGLVAAATRDAPVAGSGRNGLQWYTQLTREGVLLGTYNYISPEQFMSSNVDQRSDQFSFFVALHEALLRDVPRVGDLPLGPALAIHEGKVPPLPPPASELPEWLWRTIQRGLAYDPDRRFPTMSAALDALREPTRIRSEHSLLARGFVFGVLTAMTLVGVLWRLLSP